MGLAWPGSEPDLRPRFTASSGTHRPLNRINGDRALSLAFPAEHFIRLAMLNSPVYKLYFQES